MSYYGNLSDGVTQRDCEGRVRDYVRGACLDDDAGMTPDPVVTRDEDDATCLPFASLDDANQRYEPRDRSEPTTIERHAPSVVKPTTT